MTDSRVPGRVLGHHVYYEKVGAEPYIVQTVKEGYRCGIVFLEYEELYSFGRLEFEVEPPPSCTRNNKSALSQPEFVKTELLRLEQLGCIRRVSLGECVVGCVISLCSVLVCCALYTKQYVLCSKLCTGPAQAAYSAAYVPHLQQQAETSCGRIK